MLKSALFSLALLLCIFLSTGNAQSKLFTIDDLSNRNLYPFYQMYLKAGQLQFRHNLESYTYVTDNTLFEDVLKSKPSLQTILTLETLNKSMIKAGLNELKSFPGDMKWISGDEFVFSNESLLLIFNMKTKAIRVANKNGVDKDNADIEYKTLNIAFTIENNLFVSLPSGEDVLQVTKDSDKGIVNGQSVHRNEFGIEKGTFWSPSGKSLAFYRMDETMVTDYPIFNINERVCATTTVKYPMAGMKSHEVTVGVFNTQTKTTVFLKTGEPRDQYLTNITWSPDEKLIYIQVLNRDQNLMKLNAYDAVSGDFVKTLFQEGNPKYIEPMNQLFFMKSKPDQFLYFSKKNGYNHLYLYNSSGEQIDQITDGNFDVIQFIGFDASEKEVIYLAMDEVIPLQKHLYSIDLATKEVVKLSSVEGVHSGTISPGGKYIIDLFSTPTNPTEIDIIDVDGMLIRQAFKAENPIKDYKIGETTFGMLQADDGSDLYYRMIKPIDFMPEKKYPVIVYVYGGPHSQQIDYSWLYGGYLWLYYMSQKGFIVFTLDNRGTSNRGLKFEQAIFRNLGTVELSDQMKGIEFLKSLNYVDSTRIGVHGWSYGGFMTTTMMLKQPDVFKVGVAGAPVIDWSLYEVMYGERYMDTPESNPEGYKTANLLNYVSKLKGKLLIIHGTSDETVVWQNTLKFIEQCNHKGVQVDYYIYPGHKHSVGGVDRRHLNAKMANYFIENL